MSLITLKTNHQPELTSQESKRLKYGYLELRLLLSSSNSSPHLRYPASLFSSYRFFVFPLVPYALAQLNDPVCAQ